MREFWRNRLSVLVSRGAGTDQALAALTKQQRATVDTLHLWAKTTAIKTSERDALIEKITALYRELEQIIQTHVPGSPHAVGSANDEPVLQELEALLERKVGAVPDETDRQAAVDEGNARTSRQEPPGAILAVVEYSNVACNKPSPNAAVTTPLIYNGHLGLYNAARKPRNLADWLHWRV